MLGAKAFKPSTTKGSSEGTFWNACLQHLFARNSHHYCAEPRRGKTIQDPLTVHIDQVFIAVLQRLASGLHLVFHPGVKGISKNQGAKKTVGNRDILFENRLVHVLYLRTT